MKNRSLAFFYGVLGIYCGYLLGISVDEQYSVLLGRILYALAILIVGLFWRRIDQRSHEHHLEVWQDLRRTGKWYFILTRYVLLRGALLLLLFGSPLYWNAHSDIAADKMFALIVGVLVVMMLLLGHIEWRYCQQDFEILAVRRAAEEARHDAALYN